MKQLFALTIVISLVVGEVGHAEPSDIRRIKLQLEANGNCMEQSDGYQQNKCLFKEFMFYKQLENSVTSRKEKLKYSSLAMLSLRQACRANDREACEAYDTLVFNMKTANQREYQRVAKLNLSGTTWECLPNKGKASFFKFMPNGTIEIFATNGTLDDGYGIFRKEGNYLIGKYDTRSPPDKGYWKVKNANLNCEVYSSELIDCKVETTHKGEPWYFDFILIPSNIDKHKNIHYK